MVRSGLTSLLQPYSKIFRDELGTFKGIEVKLTVDDDATLKFFKPWSVPYAIRGAVEKDPEQLENLGVIEKKLVTAIGLRPCTVPVLKGDGSVRICGDYKVTVNPVLQGNQHPVPRVNDLFATLAGGQEFSKLDLPYTYQQLLLEPVSWKFVMVNMHKGLYQFNCLPGDHGENSSKHIQDRCIH